MARQKYFLPILIIFVVISFIAFSLRFYHFDNKLVNPTPSIQPSKPTLRKPFSLQQIFSDNHSLTSTLSPTKTVTMLVTGDIIPARSVNAGMVKRNNPLWPYEKVVDFFHTQKADIVFSNLESPQIENCPTTVEGMIFCGQTRNIAGLTHIGVTITNLANNHLGNHGKEGIEETKKALGKAEISYTGTGEPTILTQKGVRFAFLGYNDIGGEEEGLAWANEEIIRKDIQKAKALADIVIVQYHWGAEYQSQPDERQVELGRLTIDAGADLVIGNHPHWIQPIELYKGKLITYAHGNFVFDQMWSQKTREGVVGKYTFYNKELVDVEYFPLIIEDFGQPHFVDGEQKKQILEDMKLQSEILARNSLN